MEKPTINKPILPQLNEQRAAKLYDEMERNFWPIIGTANHIAMSTMFDCYDMLEEEGLLTYSVKRDINTAAREYDKYLRRVRRELKDRFPLWSDVTRLSAAKMQPKADKLHEAIKTFFDNNGVDNTELRATICTTDALIQNSCVLYDTYIERYQKLTAIDISSGFKSARMTGVQHAFRLVAKKFLNINLPIEININHDLDCTNALESLLGVFYDVDAINEACHQALVLNQDMMKYASPEDYKCFEKDDTKKENNNKKG